MTQYTVGRRGFWKPYFYELRLEGVLIAQERFWTLRGVLFAIAIQEAS